jgi:hypothetical protein
MELREPRITIINTDGGHWQLTAEGLVSASDGLESISFSVLVRRSQTSLPDLTQQAVKRAIELLQGHLDRPPATA